MGDHLVWWHMLFSNNTSRPRNNNLPKIDQQPIQILMKSQIPLRATTPEPFVNPATHKVLAGSESQINLGWSGGGLGFRCMHGRDEARTAPWPPAAAICGSSIGEDLGFRP